MKTKIAILGAGCSCAYGYPLANQMKNHLKGFVERVEHSAPKLYKIGQNTLSIFDQLEKQGSPAQTLDDLAWLVHQEKIPAKRGTFPDELADNIVNEAKTAVTAMFLEKESANEARLLAGYRTLLHEIFPDTTFSSRALKESPWRVLTFNYDRLFELAFRQHFDVDMTEAFYGPTRLNSGLYTVMRDLAEIDATRFSLLKLHGSVGFTSHEEYGQCNHHHITPDNRTPFVINDDQFFYDEQSGIHAGRPRTSLIVFPHEKKLLSDYPGNRFPYRAYIPNVWDAAHKFLSNAEEVRIVGYSVPEADWASLKSLLESVKNDCRITVQNPDANRIAEKLQMKLPNFTERVRAYNAIFGA